MNAKHEWGISAILAAPLFSGIAVRPAQGSWREIVSLQVCHVRRRYVCSEGSVFGAEYLEIYAFWSKELYLL